MSNFQSITGLLTMGEDVDGNARIVCEPIVDENGNAVTEAVKAFFVYDAPAGLLSEIEAGTANLGTLTMLRPYNTTLNNTFGWRLGVSKFEAADASLLKALKSTPAKLVKRDVVQQSEEQVKARIQQGAVRRAEKRDAKVGTATRAASGAGAV